LEKNDFLKLAIFSKVRTVIFEKIYQMAGKRLRLTVKI